MNISFQVTGDVSVTQDVEGVRTVVATGDIATSGCQDQAIADAIGIENLMNASDTSKVLALVTKEDILDFIVNVSKWDLDDIIKELTEANAEPG